MRMLPIAFYITKLDIEERFRIVKETSSITHAHIRSVIGCFYYTEFIRLLLKGYNKNEAYDYLRKSFKQQLKELGIPVDEILKYENLLDNDISIFEELEIYSTGYVVHSLEASIWCILKSDNFRDAVLKSC